MSETHEKRGRAQRKKMKRDEKAERKKIRRDQAIAQPTPQVMDVRDMFPQDFPADPA